MGFWLMTSERFNSIKGGIHATGAVLSGQNEHEVVMLHTAADQKASNMGEDFRWVLSSNACSLWPASTRPHLLKAVDAAPPTENKYFKHKPVGDTSASNHHHYGHTDMYGKSSNQCQVQVRFQSSM